MVNARILAKQRGIKVAELREASDPDYNNKIRVKTISDPGRTGGGGGLFPPE